MNLSRLTPAETLELAKHLAIAEANARHGRRPAPKAPVVPDDGEDFTDPRALGWADMICLSVFLAAAIAVIAALLASAWLLTR